MALVESKPGIRNLFVYGSLMNEFVFQKVTGVQLQGQPAMLSDYKRVQVKHKPYPACYYNSGSKVNGIVVKIESIDTIAKLDEFESILYKRITVIAQCNGPCEVDIYIWNTDLDLLSDQEWSFEDFVRDRLPHWDELHSESDL